MQSITFLLQMIFSEQIPAPREREKKSDMYTSIYRAILGPHDPLMQDVDTSNVPIKFEKNQ